MNNAESFLTVRDIADRLRISVATVYALVKQGAIASVRIGTARGAIRIQLSALAEYLNNAGQTVAVATTHEARRSRRTPLKHIKLK